MTPSHYHFGAATVVCSCWMCRPRALHQARTGGTHIADAAAIAMATTQMSRRCALPAGLSCCCGRNGVQRQGCVQSQLLSQWAAAACCRFRRLNTLVYVWVSHVRVC
eukprot:356013-Chlamydomonas_euryale.AAC.7